MGLPANPIVKKFFSNKIEGIAREAQRTVRGAFWMAAVSWLSVLLPLGDTWIQGMLCGICLCLGTYGFAISRRLLRRTKGKLMMAAAGAALGAMSVGANTITALMHCFAGGSTL